MSNENKTVYIYTDGGCTGNPGPGAYAAILTYTDSKGELHEKVLTEGFQETTNNRMEIMAAIVGIEALKFPSNIILYSDSKYLVDAFRENWINKWQANNWKSANKSPVKNVDLWKRLMVAIKPHKISFEWVKGHNGHDYNERCDQIVKTTFAGKNLKIDENYLNEKNAYQQSKIL